MGVGIVVGKRKGAKIKPNYLLPYKNFSTRYMVIILVYNILMLTFTSNLQYKFAGYICIRAVRYNKQVLGHSPGSQQC